MLKDTMDNGCMTKTKAQGVLNVSGAWPLVLGLFRFCYPNGVAWHCRRIIIIFMGPDLSG